MHCCCLAGATGLIDDNRADLRARPSAAIGTTDTATLFDWLMAALSYQGISDQVARDYMERHGFATWADIDAKVAADRLPEAARASGISTVAGTTRSAGHVRA